MRMIVCGDSYMTPVIAYPKTHFAEIVAKELNYDLEVYARGGMSNLGICLQLEEAIKQKPDIVLFDITTYDRIEIPLKRNHGGFYDMQDMIYNEKASVSSYSSLTNKNGPNLISDTLYRLLEFDYYDKIVPDMKHITHAVKEYFQFLHDPVWKQQIDYWCLYACVHKLNLSEIPYILLFPPKLFLEHCPIISVEDIVYFDKAPLMPKNDPGYHSSFEEQIEISKLIIDQIKRKGLATPPKT